MFDLLAFYWLMLWCKSSSHECIYGCVFSPNCNKVSLLPVCNVRISLLMMIQINRHSFQSFSGLYLPQDAIF